MLKGRTCSCLLITSSVSLRLPSVTCMLALGMFYVLWACPSSCKQIILQANSEVSALLGRIPSAVGYQPTLATDLGGLQERITTTKKGSITSVQAIYVPADDLTDPAPATTFAHLDATTVLSRQVCLYLWVLKGKKKSPPSVVSW